MKSKHKKIFFSCLILSFCLHLTSLFFFQRYSLWFSSFKKIAQPEEWIALFQKKERNEILQEALEPKVPETPSKLHKPQIESLLVTPKQPTLQKPEREPTKSLHFHPPTPSETLLHSHPFLAKFSIPSHSFPLLEYVSKDLMLPAPSSLSTTLLPQPASLSVILTPRLPSLDEPTPLRSTTPSPSSMELPLTESSLRPKPSQQIQLPHLPKIPSLAELDTATYSECFEADLSFVPKAEGTGYIFALTLIPKPDLELPRIRQHLTFLIDRSNSIQQGRLTATKSALYKALEELSPEDTFNILAFDSKVEKMAPTFLPCIGPSFAKAEEFIEKIQLGSFFSSGDLTRPLFLTVPSKVESDEIYTTILLTDGETLAKKQVQKSLLSDWTHYNAGKVSLYAISLNHDPHLSTLEAATCFNKGKLSIAPTNRGIKRKLLKLLKTVRSPVAKNLICSAISRTSSPKIHLFHPASQAPHLYLDQPYVILGEIDSLDDFILFVQGRLKNQWLNIKKNISFVNGRKGSSSLKQEWAIQQALRLYEQYLQNEDPRLLAEAAKILEPFDYPVAFE